MNALENKSLSASTSVNTRDEICRSNIGEHFEQSQERMLLNQGDKNSLQSAPKSTLYTSSNGSLKRDLNAHTTTHGGKTSASNEENLNGRGNSVSDEFGPAKRPRLDSRMSSLENELDNSSSIPSRTGSPTPLVNGDIKGDPRNKLMDKLLDKDLHLPLNGVCGIDSSELDLLASDGERLSSSKASSPDLFGSETNSDFGKYLEESDTDTGLFSDILQGDLRIDPMENGTEGSHPTTSKIPTFPVGSYNEGGNVSNDKGIPAGVAQQQGKVPIPPAVRPDPLPGQYNATASRTPLAGNTAWNSTNNVNLASKAGFGQSLGPDVQQKMSFYPQQGTPPANVGNRSQMQNVTMENKTHQFSSTPVTIQKAIFPHQNIQPSPQQMIASHDSSAIHSSVVPKNILPRPQGPDIVNSRVPVAQGSGIQQSPMVSSFHGARQMPPVQTSLPRVNVDPSRGMPPGWAPSGVQHQQVPVAPHVGARTQPGSQTAAPAGFQVGLPHNASLGTQAPTVPPGPQTMGLSSGWQPQLQQQQKSANAYQDMRSQSVAAPGSGMYEAASVPQNRPPTGPMQFQHPALPPAGKGVVQNPVGSMPINPTGTQEFASTPPVHGSQVESSVPQMVSFKPYRCRWTACYRYVINVYLN